MKKVFRLILLVFIVLAIVYLVGPEMPKPVLSTALPSVPDDLYELEATIAAREGQFNLRPDNHARFIWASDSLRQPTEFALLYLHGFSASWYEGYPVNVEFAEKYGCNAFFARLATHGIDTTDALLNMTPDALWESAKEALVIAGKIGRKVIIMGSSTGASLALKLAAEYPSQVAGLFLYSPNVRINNKVAFLLSKPWGLQLARASYKGLYRVTNEDFNSKDCQYWNCKYRLEAVVYLQQLVESTMKTKVFRQVTAPVFMGYYYKDEENQDQVVRIDAALKMFDELGTPLELKQKQAFDAGAHVIACELFSKSIDDIREATFAFAEFIPGLSDKLSTP